MDSESLEINIQQDVEAHKNATRSKSAAAQYSSQSLRTLEGAFAADSDVDVVLGDFVE